ncbi:MAG: polysaccharide biosynthesis protein [Lachnospiraceae bacterium]|nr:polysaccharide biosynthesis protein [Lachnospiraceae bacterium]
MYEILSKSMKNPILKGTLILTITGLLTRFFGFYNRIFLSNLIGAKELGIYQLVFPVYMIIFSFTTLGNELALTRITSEYVGRNENKSAQTFFKICLFYNIVLGMCSATVLYFFADEISLKILNTDSCGNCLKVICLGIPFMAAKGAIHGYFLGLERSDVHGISDFIEQIAKIGGVYLLATFIAVKNSHHASFAIIGIVIGEIISFIYSAIMLLINNKCKQNIYGQSIKTTTAFSIFLKESMPLTANRFAITLLQGIEAVLIPSMLLAYYNDSSISLSVYGIFTGMAFPFIMFPATITNSLSVMLMPAVSSASSGLKNDYLSKLCERSIRFCLLIGLFFGVTFYIFGNSIGTLIFNNKEAGIFLYRLSFLCPLIYLATTQASALNGLGLATHNLILTILSTAIRLSFILTTIPKIGMKGYVVGLFVSYLFLTYASLNKLKKNVIFELKMLRDIIVPFAFFLITGVVTYIFYDILTAHLNNMLRLPILLASLLLYGTVCFVCFGIRLVKHPC